ncbi:hypothetical protein T492DRAFT_1012166 [Pavlovales sp. CCMP2436]|nr:hypothetical protein T492DRAFT_1012166 [Pavlovales sp. CCMP2436]|mmetsp:Transcript_47444/g.110694  ORF Transcript_47444/g.110694 Transcript_47444/m.110694 type:complete len:200 (+) Transcript_47444:234-833(+)
MVKSNIDVPAISPCARGRSASYRPAYFPAQPLASCSCDVKGPLIRSLLKCVPERSGVCECADSQRPSGAGNRRLARQVARPVCEVVVHRLVAGLPKVNRLCRCVGGVVPKVRCNAGGRLGCGHGRRHVHPQPAARPPVVGVGIEGRSAVERGLDGREQGRLDLARLNTPSPQHPIDLATRHPETRARLLAFGTSCLALE